MPKGSFRKISDEVVKEITGKSSEQWCKILYAWNVKDSIHLRYTSDSVVIFFNKEKSLANSIQIAATQFFT